MSEQDFVIGNTNEHKDFAVRNGEFLKVYDQFCNTFEKVILRKFYAPTPEQDLKLKQLDPSDPEYDALQKEVSGARIIYFFGHLAIQDFQELLTLCTAGFGYGAFKTLRGLYEKTVTAMYLSKNPDQIMDYADYMFIDANKIMKRLREGNADIDLMYSREYLEELSRGYERARAKLKESVCNRCGTPKTQLSWSRLDMATMAKAVGEGLDDLLLKCYVEPTAHTHATALSFAERIKETAAGKIEFSHAPQRERADLALFYAHRLMIYQVEIQNVHFQLGFDDEIVERAKEYAEAWKDRIAKINSQLSKTNPVFRFCVGSSDAKHSMVWKIWSRTGDIYISNRSGSEFILQQSGECKWSVSRNEPTTESAEELLWQRPNPTGTSAAHVFRIIIPESELRGDEISENSDNVRWIATPARGHATYIECYMTPPLDTPEGASFPYEALHSFQLPDSSWLVVLLHEEPMTPQHHSVLSENREMLLGTLRSKGIEQSATMRSVAISRDSSGTTSAFEIVPFSDS
jgi:uncharacterized protein DUF5677